MITSTLAFGSAALFLSETLYQEYPGYSNRKHKL